MHSSDIPAFTDMLDAVSRMLSRGNYTPDPTSTTMFFRSMQRYSIETVRAAFDAHVADPVRGRFVPVPADLIAQIEGMLADDGRLGADEAWALALQSRDEGATVVWTPEVAQAFAVVRPVLDARDETGARMAFREAYNRIVAAARADRTPVQWQPTLGHDRDRRDLAIAAAVASGRLEVAPVDMAALPGPRDVPLLLLGGGGAPDSGEPPPEAVAALRALRDRLASRRDAPSADAAARADTARRQAAARAQWMTVDEICDAVEDVRANPELLAAIANKPNRPTRSA